MVHTGWKTNSEVLILTHDDVGYSGSTRAYIMVKRLYYCKGFENNVQHHTKRHKACLQRNRKVVCYAKLHFNVPETSKQFISMYLIGESNAYALTVIRMLTGYTFYVLIKTKTASDIVQTYIDNVYSEFGGSSHILSDNGTEFKKSVI